MYVMTACTHICCILGSLFLSDFPNINSIEVIVTPKQGYGKWVDDDDDDMKSIYAYIIPIEYNHDNMEFLD